MRILTLANTPLDESTGSGYVVRGYARRLRELGCEVELLGPPDFELLHGFSRAIGHRQVLGMARATWRRLGETRYDLLEIWGVEGWLAFSLLAGRIERPLLVARSNGLEPHCTDVLRAAGNPYPRRFWQPELRRLGERAFRLADALVTVSHWDADYARDHRYQPASRLLTLENPLPACYLDRPVTFDRPLVIGYCGAWLPIKGIDRLRRELPALLREQPDWRLTLVGVGEDFQVAEHFPADLLARIEVIPHAERERDLPALYQGFSILVLPSLYESFGLVAAEAMACGAAVVASPVGFAAGLVPGEEVVHCHPTPGGLAAALHGLMADEETRQRIARRGYRRVQTLRWEEAGERLLTAYRGWLEERRRLSAGAR